MIRVRVCDDLTHDIWHYYYHYYHNYHYYHYYHCYHYGHYGHYYHYVVTNIGSYSSKEEGIRVV